SVFRKRLHDPRRRQQKFNEQASAEVFSIASRARSHNALPVVPQPEPLSEDAEIYQALVVGTRDYVVKNGFKKVVLGLSGGMNSALTACIAADALGSGNVVGVLMPSEFSSRGSIEDSQQLGKNLGIELLTISITDVYHAFKTALKAGFKGARPDVTEETLQARSRGR